MISDVWLQNHNPESGLPFLIGFCAAFFRRLSLPFESVLSFFPRKQMGKPFLKRKWASNDNSGS